MLKLIYLSPVGYLISILLNFFALFTRPFMIYGYFDRKNKTFLKNTRISSTATIINSKQLDIGNNCWIWHHSIIDASNGISIGEGSQIGAFVGIFTHSSHIAIRLLGENFIFRDAKDRIGYIKSPVSIGKYSFIAAGSIIMPGTKIGKGCVIGAGSIVKGNIPDFSIVSGNPARIIGTTNTLDLRYIKKHPDIQSTYFDAEHFTSLYTESHKKKSSK